MQTGTNEWRNSGRKTVALLWLGILALVSTSHAQTNTPPRPRQAEEQLFPGGPGRFGIGPERLMNLLTEEQRASLREIMAGQREKARDLEEKARDARRALYETGLLDKFDEEATRQKAMAAAKLDAELTVLRLKALSQVRPPLSAQQLQKLATPQSFPGQAQDETPRRRRFDFPRDENGLPPKDRVPAEPK
jgi:Spy/CpxP family protein refolding chaperone